MEDMVANAIRIDFAAEGCQWEVPAELCEQPGAGLAGMGVYCAKHLAIWRQELERREEWHRGKLPGLQDWYQRMTKQAAP